MDSGFGILAFTPDGVLEAEIKILPPNVCHSEHRAQNNVVSCYSTAGRGARNLCISALSAAAISGDREIKGYTP